MSRKIVKRAKELMEKNKNAYEPIRKMEQAMGVESPYLLTEAVLSWDGAVLLAMAEIASDK